EEEENPGWLAGLARCSSYLHRPSPPPLFLSLTLPIYITSGVLEVSTSSRYPYGMRGKGGSSCEVMRDHRYW
ncbi:hypothetical protein CABS01_03358, partial [Colletotrichum abscissum]|uniref:uncharacterized protein n=1 Tax=Colletotrichum abscissum TaxID=1671311 RepID=UPI0027D712F9